MNKKILLPLLIIALALYWNVTPAGAVSINLELLDSYIETGESFDVAVYAQEDSAAGSLTAFGFNVDFVTLFNCDSYTVGSYFMDVGYNTDSSLPVDYAAGLLNLGVSNAGSNVLLATLSFTAGSIAGANTLSIAGPYDGFDHGLYYEDWNYDSSISASTQITIHDTEPVPEPATMLLFGTGLVGLVSYRLRKK